MEKRDIARAHGIIPLALPKGTEKLCELCQSRAYLQCERCRVTYYCDVSHQFADWVGIHQRICELLVPVRVETLQSFTKQGRIEKDIKKRELIAISRAVAEGKLAEGKPEEALPAGQTFLRFSVDVFGSCSMELIPAHLLLAEAHIGLGKMSAACELLAEAQMSVHKSPDCGHELNQSLHRCLGRLHNAMGNLEDACFHFATDIYHAAEAYGLESTVCKNGYFLLAQVFVKKGKTPIVQSMYYEVAQTWHTHLTELMKPFLENPAGSLVPTFDNSSLKPGVGDKAKLIEADKMLQTVLDFERKQSRKHRGLTALASHCLALLWFMIGDRVKAKGFGHFSLESSKTSPDQELRPALERLLQLLEEGPDTASSGL
ncbi:unnamed protein product [Knipowitschia caucasica]|uniref:MYND-type domain-containing protein n=1 Tax=Knipowitschia caucasica TaxID=637954 RepID=A0AAV2LXJ3_KNICA